jgi:hypothetical protein
MKPTANYTVTPVITTARKRREGRGIAARETKGHARGEQRLAARETKDERRVKFFGKWFTENFSVNRFPKFC